MGDAILPGTVVDRPGVDEYSVVVGNKLTHPNNPRINKNMINIVGINRLGVFIG